MARVLVADDEEGCRDLLEIALGDEHEVRSVEDGHAALELANAWAPDVAIVDLTLDGLSGIDVARALQGRVVVLAFTGWGEVAREHLALFEAVLSKPALPAEIRAAVAAALERHQA